MPLSGSQRRSAQAHAGRTEAGHCSGDRARFSLGGVSVVNTVCSTHRSGRDQVIGTNPQAGAPNISQQQKKDNLL